MSKIAENTFSYDNMTTEQEREFLVEIIKNEGFDFCDDPECNGILREVFNNDVLSLFESKYSDKAFPLDSEGNASEEPDYSDLTETIFSDLLGEVTSDLSIDSMLSIGNIYSIMREKFNNKILDEYREKWEYDNGVDAFPDGE